MPKSESIKCGGNGILYEGHDANCRCIYVEQPCPGCADCAATKGTPMPEPKSPKLDPGNEEMRRLSGEVDDASGLVAFLYVLMRDHLTPGVLEEIHDNHVAIASGKVQNYVNGWLSRYAQDLARRLTVGDTDAVQLIAQERQRQIDAEGYSPDHDDGHTDGSIAVVAAALAVHHTDASIDDPLKRVDPVESGRRHDCWGLLAKHGYDGTNPDEIKVLVIAGALIAAEIDRMQRSATFRQENPDA